MIRARQIAQLPKLGGKPCPDGILEEMSPCNTETCDKSCVDGAWAPWEDWSLCTQTCLGGLTFRTRSVLREADECGKPISGLHQEMASCNSDVSCNVDVDCKFSNWELWSACTESCNGIKRRARVIAQATRGDGRRCFGGMSEVSMCNPSPGEFPSPQCMQSMRVDCVLSDWSEYSPCSSSCRGGQHQRNRQILVSPDGGGRECPTTLAETSACNDEPCPGQCKPSDCVFSDWSSWGTCTKCGGQRFSTRSILHQSACGGKTCDLASDERTELCTRECHTPTFCAWAEWVPWSSCSTSCGWGTQERTRNLAVVAAPVEILDGVGDIEEGIQSLRSKASALESRRTQEIIVAFASGVGLFVAGLFALRVTASLRNNRVMDGDALQRYSRDPLPE